MNQKLQRIKIAEACGWKPDKRGLGWLNPHGYYAPEPDYLNDLNAMHEAEKVLTEEQRVAYSDHTYDIACEEQNTTGRWKWLSLTAAQRAEAFLRTIGKWQVSNDKQTKASAMEK